MENNYLMHHGVKGMRWGVRKKRKQVEEPAHEDYTRAHSKTSVRTMSDRELRETNNRLQAEKQYRELTKTVSKGRKAVNTFIAIAGTTAAVITAANQFGQAYKTGKTAASKIASFAGSRISGVGVDTLSSMAGKI